MTIRLGSLVILGLGMCIRVTTASAGSEKSMQEAVQDAEKTIQKKHKQSTFSYPEMVFENDDNGKPIIPICTSFPLKGDYGIVGQRMLAGTKNYLKAFHHILKEFNGKEYPFSIRHYGNNSSVGWTGYKKIKKLQKQSPIFVGLVGLGTLFFLIQQLKKKKMLLYFPTVGDVDLRKLNFENLVYFRPSYEQELKALVSYCINVRRRKKVAIFYEASEWGERLHATLLRLLKPYDIDVVIEASYPQSTVEVKNATTAISNASPNAVFCLAHPRSAYSFIRNAPNVGTGLHNSLFFGLSELQVIQKLLLTDRGMNIITTCVVPDPKQEPEMPIIKEYMHAMKSFLSFRDHSPFYLEAYIGITLFVELLNMVKQPFTLEKIAKAVQGLRGKTIKGLKLRGSRGGALSAHVWINPGVNKKWIKWQEGMFKDMDQVEGYA